MPKPSIPKGPWTTKRLAQGRRQEKYMENWQLPFFIKNCSIMLHCSSLLSSPSVPVVEEKQGEGKGQEPSAELINAQQKKQAPAQICPSICPSIEPYLLQSHPIFPFFFYLILSCPIHLSPLLTSPSNPS